MKEEYKFAIVLNDVKEGLMILGQSSNGTSYKSKIIEDVNVDKMIEICDIMNEIMDKFYNFEDNLGDLGYYRHGKVKDE